MSEAWGRVAEREPTKEDADAAGCLLFWHAYNGTMLTGYFQYRNNRYLTHWRKMPEPPENWREEKRRIEQEEKT